MNSSNVVCSVSSRTSVIRMPGGRAADCAISARHKAASPRPSALGLVSCSSDRVSSVQHQVCARHDRCGVGSEVKRSSRYLGWARDNVAEAIRYLTYSSRGASRVPALLHRAYHRALARDEPDAGVLARDGERLADSRAEVLDKPLEAAPEGACLDARDLLSRFGEKLLNGLFIEADATSMMHRRAIADWVVERGASIRKLLDFGGGFGTLASLIARLLSADE